MSSWRPSVPQRVAQELHDHFMRRNDANLPRRTATSTPQPYRRVVTQLEPVCYRIVAKIGVNSLARSDAGRRRWQAPGPRMWHTSETLVIGIEPGIGCRAQPKSADKLLSKLRRMALLGLPAGREYGVI